MQIFSENFILYIRIFITIIIIQNTNKTTTDFIREKQWSPKGCVTSKLIWEWELNPRVSLSCQEEREEPGEKTKQQSPEKHEENQGSGIPAAN